jgi:DNA mismatch repair protein MSH4
MKRLSSVPHHTLAPQQRATSTHEGIAIAHAVSESLIKNRVSTIFATHFTLLASTLSPYSNFGSHHLLVSLVQDGEGPRSFSFRHRIAAGISKEEHYGLVMARDCQLPLEVLEEADRMARSLQQKTLLAQSQSKGTKTANRRAIVVELEKNLQDLCALDYMPASQFRKHLISLQANFVKDMDESLPIGTDCEVDYEEERELESMELYTDYNMREI